MEILEIISGLAAFAVFSYLLVALLNPEIFP